MMSLALFLVSVASGTAILAGAKPLLSSPYLLRENYAGRKVPTGTGILFVPVYTLSYVLYRVFGSGGYSAEFGPPEALLVLVLGMSSLGLLDDLAGDRSIRGFKGHLSAAFQGRVTTGWIKAVTGFLVALAVSFPLSEGGWDLLVNALLISLASNSLNLLDVRPGRALKAFFLLLGIVLALSWEVGGDFMPLAVAVGGAALVMFPGDLRERFMLGDAGSNVLGATVGLGLVLGVGTWWKLGIVIFLSILNLVSEILSFSSIIEGNRVLSRFDRLGRKGDPGLKAK